MQNEAMPVILIMSSILLNRSYFQSNALKPDIFWYSVSLFALHEAMAAILILSFY